MKLGAWDHDDDLLESVRHEGTPHIRFVPSSETAVVLGRGSDPEKELRLEDIERDGVSVLRRRGGGCAVVLDPGNAIVSVVLPVPGVGGISQSFDRISARLIESFAASGLPGVTQEGVSDLVLDDLKIGGSCIYRARDILYYSTTLLVDPDLELSLRYLKHPPREPDYRRGRDHGAFMGSLSTMLGPETTESIVNRLPLALEDNLVSTFNEPAHHGGL
jgi:lipoate-protein ligase A